MEVETKLDSMSKDKDTMNVDNTEEQEEDEDKKSNRKDSKSPKTNVKNKLLLFKFETNKRSSRSSSQENSNKIENQVEEEEDEDVVDISNEVLISDLNKKRKRKDSNEMKIKKKRKSVNKVEEKQEGKEELKENKKSDDNVLKNDKKDKVIPVEKEEQKNNNKNKTSGDKVDTGKVDVKEDTKSAKTKSSISKKSPIQRKSKSNETKGSKPLLTMDKFIIIKKTPEEVEKEKLAKEMEKKKLDNDDVMIIENNEINSKDNKEKENNCKQNDNKEKDIPESILEKKQNEGKNTQSEISSDMKIKSVSEDNMERSDNSSSNKDELSDKLSETKQVANKIEDKMEYNEDVNRETKEIETKEETSLESKEDDKKETSETEKKDDKNKSEDTLETETSKEKKTASPTTNKTDKPGDKSLTKPSRKSPKTPKRKSNDKKEKTSPITDTGNSSTTTTNTTTSTITISGANNSNNSKEDIEDIDMEEVDENPPKEDDQNNTTTTPNAKLQSNLNNKTPKNLPKQTLEPKKLTPKQIEKQEELAKKREELQKKKEEKEAEKERLRLEKEQKKLEEEEKRKKEREEKEEQKRKEKEEKEKVRKEQEEAKNREKQVKEEQRLMQIEAKNKEKAAREQERLAVVEEKRKREEAEKEKKEKAAAAFASFFKKSGGEVGGGGGVKKTTGGDGGGGVGAEENVEMMDTSVEISKLNFMPFEIKGDMRMAPLVRTLFTPERSSTLDSILTNSPIRKHCLYLSEIKQEGYVKGKGDKTWPVEVDEEPDVIILESELDDIAVLGADEGDPDSRGASLYKYPGTSNRVRRRAKLLQFHENRRPPYFGTWSKRSQKIRARNPFKMDETIFEYEVDSEEEWEDEGEGESLRGSEDEKEEDDEEGGGNDYEVDNQMFVPHGYLSDEEEREDEDENLDPEAHKMKLKLMELEFEEQMSRKTERLRPRLVGCVFLSNNGLYSNDNVGNHIRDLLLTRKALYVDLSLPIPIQDESVPSQSNMGGSPSTSHNSMEVTSGGVVGGKTGTPSTQTERLTSIPDSEMTDLIRLVHGSHVNRKNLCLEFHTFLASNGKELPRILIHRTIREIAEYMLCPLSECAPNTYPRKCWFVKSEIRTKFGLPDFLAYQNSWKFLVEPTSLTGGTTTPTSSKKDTGSVNKKETSGAPGGQTPVTSKKKSIIMADGTPTLSKSCSTDTVEKKGVTSEKEGGEKVVCSVSSTMVESAPSTSSLITNFTKVLSEEERIEQLKKTKITTSSKPKSCTELFKSQLPEGDTNPISTNNTTPSEGSGMKRAALTSSGGTVKKRATLITIAKTCEEKTNPGNTDTQNKTDLISSSQNKTDLNDGTSQKETLASKKTTENNVEERNIECIDLDENVSKTDAKDKTDVENNTVENKIEKQASSVGGKTPKSARKTMKISGKTPVASGKKSDTSGKTPVSSGKVPVASGKTPVSSAKTPGNSKNSPQVSIMNFVTKTAAPPPPPPAVKRKSDDVKKDDEEQSARKKIKLDKILINNKDNKVIGEKKDETPVECIEIESSNEGW